MLDLKFIRENKDKVRQNILNRKVDLKLADVDKLLELDEKHRQLIAETETIRAERNVLAHEKNADRNKGIELKKQLEEKEKELKKIKQELDEVWQWIPNIMSEDTPVGSGQNDNVDIRVWIPGQGYLDKKYLGKGNEVASQMPKLSFKGKDHIELGKELDIIDVDQSGIVAGSRFSYLKGAAVILQYAIFDLLSKELIKKGFTPMIVPLLVKERVLFGTSHFPEGREQVYRIETSNIEDQNQLFLVGSSEPPLFAYGMDRKFNAKDLPFKMFAFTSCFRSEVGSWGKDVRGIKRVHQFDKLEMDVICLPEQAEEIFAELLSMNEWLLQKLELPYRIIFKNTADAGYVASHKQFDVEVWRMLSGEFMETMTDTNTTDFQARRLNIKFQKGEEKGYCFTLNDTGAAMGRLIIAILENYQQKDGSVVIPEVLRGYTGFEVIKPK